MGPLRLVASPRGLVEIVLLAGDANPAQARAAEALGIDAAGAPQAEPTGAPQADIAAVPQGSITTAQAEAIRSHLALTSAELTRYFAGQLRVFTVPLDFRLSSGFYLDVRRSMRNIPYGEVITYGELARMAGRPGAARAVGTACARNPIPIIVPCHRVVPASGGIGAYSGGAQIKEALLRLEGTLGESPRPAR